MNMVDVSDSSVVINVAGSVSINIAVVGVANV